MGGFSVWHWILFLLVALLLFGGSGKISSIKTDVAQGIKSFKKGMAEDDEAAQAPQQPPKALDSIAAKPEQERSGAEVNKAH